MSRSAARVAVALSLLAGTAAADTPPSKWERAADPSLARSWDLHVEVQRLVDLEHRGGGMAGGRVALERARSLLEAAGAERSADVRLRLDLGTIYEQLDHHERAIEVLVPALAAAKDHPASTDGWITLAYAYAKLPRHREERAAYGEYLRRVSDDRLRVTALLNMAEASMHLGQLRDSIREYREAIRVGAELSTSMAASESVALAQWGLAVALDRAGDREASVREARLAASLDPGMRILGGPNVFFVPAYERSWYVGLGAYAQATEARGEAERAALMTLAERSFAHYVESAGAGDRWLATARARLASIARARGRRGALSPPPRPDGDPSL